MSRIRGDKKSNVMATVNILSFPFDLKALNGLHSRFELKVVHSELKTCLNSSAKTQLNVFTMLKEGKEENLPFVKFDPGTFTSIKCFFHLNRLRY